MPEIYTAQNISEEEYDKIYRRGYSDGYEIGYDRGVSDGAYDPKLVYSNYRPSVADLLDEGREERSKRVDRIMGWE